MDCHSCWAAQSSKLGAQEKNIRTLDPIQTANQREYFFPQLPVWRICLIPNSQNKCKDKIHIMATFKISNHAFSLR